MKTIYILLILLLSNVLVYGQVGVGTISPDSSSILHVSSTSKGVLLPRLTTAERNAINNPAEGLMIYNTTNNRLEINFGTPSTPLWTYTGYPVNLSSFSISVSCEDSNGFNGSQMKYGEALTDQTFKVTLVNNTISNNVNLSFSESDLYFGGIGGVNVSSVTPTQFTLNSGQSVTVTYGLSGTPTWFGTLEGTWEQSYLSCSDTSQVAEFLASAVLSVSEERSVPSVSDTSTSTNVQGIIDNSSNQIKFYMTYTSGSGNYLAYTGPWVSSASGAGENGDTNSFRISYPAGTFSGSGVIPIHVEVSGDGQFNAKKLPFGQEMLLATIPVPVFANRPLNSDSIKLYVRGGILDRNFDDIDHQFVYMPITAEDGKVWLNNNLGAYYAKIGYSQYNPSKQATSSSDRYAYGSSYQWGRYSDGHELMNYSNGSTGSSVNGSTGVNATSDTPGHSLFIREPNSPYDWRTPQNNNLWQGEYGINNPCPHGYRLPTESEILALFSSAGITTSTPVYPNSNLKISSAGYRTTNINVVQIVSVGTYGKYHTSTVSGFYSKGPFIYSGGYFMSTPSREGANSVRCIRDY